MPLQLLDAVLFVELIYTTAGVDQLLLAGIEGMALGADFYGDILLRAAGLIYSAAGAADGGGFVIRMDASFIVILSFIICCLDCAGKRA